MYDVETRLQCFSDISEMESDKRQIGKERAKKIAEALHVSDYRVFL